MGSLKESDQRWEELPLVDNFFVTCECFIHILDDEIVVCQNKWNREQVTFVNAWEMSNLGQYQWCHRDGRNICVSSTRLLRKLRDLRTTHPNLENLFLHITPVGEGVERDYTVEVLTGGHRCVTCYPKSADDEVERKLRNAERLTEE